VPTLSCRTPNTTARDSTIDTTVPSSSRSRTQPSPAAGLIFRSIIFNSALRRHTYRAQHTQTFSAVRPHNSNLVAPPLTSRPRDRNLSPGQLPWTLVGAYSGWRHHDDTMPKKPTMTYTKHQPRRLSYHVRQPAWSSGDCSSAGGYFFVLVLPFFCSSSFSLPKPKHYQNNSLYGGF